MRRNIARLLKSRNYYLLFTPRKSVAWLKWCAGGVAGIIGAFLLLNVLFPLRVQITYSPVITASDGSVINAFLNPDDKWRMQLQPGEINPLLKKALLLKEDRYFYYHPGVNPVALGRAFVNNVTAGKTTSGASTITMQVARLLYPKERTLKNKLVELFRALQLEWRYSKDEILTLYLNLVPFGGNIEGVKAASVLYFQQSPKQLSLAQAVTLTVIPNKPSSLRIGVQNSRIVAFRNKWLRYFAEQKAFPEKEIVDAINEPLVAVRSAAPQIAPHFAYRLLQQYPNQVIIQTNLNRAIQEKVTQLAYNYLQQLRPKNIRNTSVLVINNQTKAVEAYLGSADFSDSEHGGQVDGIRAIRSPGSTLKPLLYAVAFDKGLITPRTIISDVPIDYAGYRPENYFGNYNGNITIEYALATSLNIPAVKMLDKLGVPTFVNKLKQVEFKQIKKDSNDLGLSLILGGCGVKLEELTALYTAFANQGGYTPLRWLQTEKLNKKRPIISPAASYVVNQILTQLQRPDLPHNFQNSGHLPKIAWKTGTSYGRKDAWSIGYNKKYTVGVWVGNFSGEGVPELNGTDSATPLLFDIFNTIDYNSVNDWFTAPASLAQRSVCTVTGQPANTFCSDRVLDTYLPGISPVKKCEHLKEVTVSADEKYAYCTTCLPETGYIRKRYPNYAPEILTFYEAEHIPYVKIPAHNPQCPRIFSEFAPVITAPAPDMEYLLERAEKQKLMLHCNAHNEVKQVYWYINDKLFQAARANQNLFFTPEKAGRYKISCLDDQGRNTNSFITVRFLD
ncbi:penicillin-binding protein 1C [Adhaeribacter radiodurans]|uniref:peptidoglycan glycosyltransferase n=1 Tax=Adhaeribacter radiodurans TaxID=2745197 RepID=A0A7L7LFB5_9BACT|nr:penicillin-binding protein 1C [Adhaeribacter radiodurans]QMU31384.1 penicillin-binding protein 1C [Adhaeribacter radiodurans]